jgi:hypothetical protein
MDRPEMGNQLHVGSPDLKRQWEKELQFQKPFLTCFFRKWEIICILSDLYDICQISQLFSHSRVWLAKMGKHLHF